MKITFSLALRNIFRNKRRTMMTFLAIISGMIGLIVFGGFVEYTFRGLREMTIHTQLGHIQIYKKGYSDKGIADPHKYLINNFKNVERVLSKVEHVKLITARLTFSGLISRGEQSLTCMGKGIMPEREKQFSTFETIIEGKPLSPDIADGVVIGSELKKSLGGKIGDYLTVLTTTVDGVINAADFRLVGVAQSGSADYDKVFVELPLNMVQKLLNTTSVEKVIVLLDKTENVNKTARQLRSIFKKEGLDLELKTWSELAVFYHKVVALYNGLFNVMRVIIAVIVLFSIANTMTMSVFERVREIGTLRAIGTKKGGILRLFVAEGFMIGVFGGILGIIFGVIAACVINFSGGIYIPPPPGMSRGYTALILIVPKVIVYSFILMVLISTISSIYPALKAVRLKIIDALRHS